MSVGGEWKKLAMETFVEHIFAIHLKNHSGAQILSIYTSMYIILRENKRCQTRVQLYP